MKVGIDFALNIGPAPRTAQRDDATAATGRKTSLPVMGNAATGQGLRQPLAITFSIRVRPRQATSGADHQPILIGQNALPATPICGTRGMGWVDDCGGMSARGMRQPARQRSDPAVHPERNCVAMCLCTSHAGRFPGWRMSKQQGCLGGASAFPALRPVAIRSTSPFTVAGAAAHAGLDCQAQAVAFPLSLPHSAGASDGAGKPCPNAVVK